MRLLKKKKHRHGSSIVYIFCPFSIFLIFPVTTRSSFLPAVGTIACYGVHRRGCPYTYYQTRQRHKLREHFGISPFFFSFHVDDNNSPRAHTHTHTPAVRMYFFIASHSGSRSPNSVRSARDQTDFPTFRADYGTSGLSLKKKN